MAQLTKPVKLSGIFTWVWSIWDGQFLSKTFMCHIDCYICASVQLSAGKLCPGPLLWLLPHSHHSSLRISGSYVGHNIVSSAGSKTKIKTRMTRSRPAVQERQFARLPFAEPESEAITSCLRRLKIICDTKHTNTTHFEVNSMRNWQLS